MLKQTTLKGSFSLYGKGLHTGLSLTVTFNPAPENTGYKIKRMDLEDQPVIDALAERVVDTQRGTVLANGDVRVSTVEHGLAALYAMGIDNCLIQVNGPEFPILDGSAIMYVEEIKKVGIEEQNAPKDYYIIRHKIEVKDDKTGSCITILPDDQFSITAMCSFDSKFINSQFATLDTLDNFEKEIAPARTFVFVRDIEPLLKANLIKGGDMDNAIVIYEKMTDQKQLDQLAIYSRFRVWMRLNRAISNISLWFGKTNAPDISCSTSLATWHCWVNLLRGASLPPVLGTPSTICLPAICVRIYANTRCRHLYTTPTKNRLWTISAFANSCLTVIQCSSLIRLFLLVQQALLVLRM